MRSLGEVEVLRGQTTGFAAPAEYELGLYARTLALADVSGDGDLDIVAAGVSTSPTSAGAIAVLVNPGNGVFATRSNYVTMSQLDDVAVGDVDGDGDRDVVVSSSFVGARPGASVFVNTGGGTLATERALPVPSTLSIALANLDGDNVLDVALYIRGGMVGLRGRGDGSFVVGEAAPLEPVLATDVNADGRADLLGVRSANKVGLFVAISDSDGAPTAPVTYEAPGLPNLPMTVTLHDVDRDGVRDAIVLAYVYRATYSTIAVLRGNADGTFATTQTYTATGAVPLSVAVGDVTGDCEPDLVVASAGMVDHGITYPGAIVVLPNMGSGTFSASIRVGDAARRVVLADLDGDRWADLVVEREGQLHVHRSLGLGQFAAPTPLGPGTLHTVADVNGDGVLDILADDVWLGAAGGSFAAPLQTPTPHEIADLDGDGDLDGTSDQSVLFGRGDGTFVEVRNLFGRGPIGDVDNDGRPDIAGTRILRQQCP